MKTKKAGMLGILFLAVLAVLAPCASAQESAAKGTLNGTVVDSTGGTIVGASVTLSGPFGDVNQLTNGSGVFIFQDLVPGAYKIRIEMKGFKTSQVAGVTINVGSVTAIRVPLEPGKYPSRASLSGTMATLLRARL